MYNNYHRRRPGVPMVGQRQMRIPPMSPTQQTVYGNPRQVTRRDFMNLAHARMPIQAIKVVDDMPPTIRHICPKIMPIHNPVRILEVQHFPELDYQSIPFYYCNVCQEFIYSWIS